MFEGIEKKFELLVASDQPSLRGLGREVWAKVVERAGATVLSEISNRYGDALLLSESSLFIYDRRAVMITCGRTSLVSAVQHLTRHVPPAAVRSFIYERKNENFPHLQRSTFEEDVSILNRILPGTALRFGDPGGHHLSLFHLNKPFHPAEDDITAEILMYGLAPEVCAAFGGNGTGVADPGPGGGIRATVSRLLPGFRTDDHSFEPRGYSLNAIREAQYFTVHVTPEESGSYASFETNAPLSESALRELTVRTVRLFRPRRFDLVLFQNRIRIDDMTDTYDLVSHETHRLQCGYRLQFSHYRQGGRRFTGRDAADARGAARFPEGTR